MSTTFVPFTESRKKQIAHMRNRLITIKPTVDAKYGNKTKHLGLTDFVVYAALRGADFRKAGVDGDSRAVNCMRSVINLITYYGTSVGGTGTHLRTRFLSEDQNSEDLFELKNILEEQLEFWSNK